MHREFDPTTEPLQPRSNAALYGITLLVLALLAADLLPLLASGLRTLGLDSGLDAWPRGWRDIRFALMAAVLGIARALFVSLDRLSEGKIGADLAVAIAGLAAIVIGEPLVAAEVVAIGLIGECLEAWTFARTKRAVQSLGELFPQRCWVLREGQEVRVLASELVVGDRVVVKPGGKIPVDGQVIDGRSSVNAAALTGESLPLEKGPGDPVLAGSLNELGTLTIDAEKVGSQTVAGQVIELTVAAIRDKAPIERTADRYARYFLPIVLTLAVVAFAFNLGYARFASAGPATSWASAARQAVYPALAVLVVACPCPLVLATPAAVLAAIGRLAGTGVLLKSGAALERLAAIRSVALDKTGTLTEGRLVVGDVECASDIPRERLLMWAAAAEAGSEHPLARAIRDAAKAFPSSVVTDFQAFPGLGVQAVVDGEVVLVGTRRFLVERNLPWDDSWDARLKRFDETGQSAALVAVNNRIVGVIGARDVPRPESAGVLNEFQSLGLKPLILLTGDRPGAAQSIASQLPLDAIHAGLLPGEKTNFLTPGMAFIGDGINDAPALARADIGLAMAGSGNDVAAEAGDVVLMGGKLRPLPLLIRLSRETVRVIRQNIVWFGFGVNLFGILLTGFLWPFVASSPNWFDKAPLVGVLYHQLGSLLVLLNSMRLLGFERSSESPVLRQITARYRDADRWLNTIHLDDVLHGLTHRARPIGFAVLGIGFFGWLLSGLTQIDPGHTGVVKRFGAAVADLHPGLHWRWPYGIEETVKVNVDEVRTVEIGFRRLTAPQRETLRQARAEQEKLRASRAPESSTWTSGHGEEIARLTDESIFLTGDGNAVEILATVHYTIPDARTRLAEINDPDKFIRSITETVFRELTASSTFLDLLTAGRARFASSAQSMILSRIQLQRPSLGLHLVDVTVHDLHPPQDVVAAYHLVAEAIQRRDRMITDAEAEATRTKRQAEQDALRTVRMAEAEAIRKTSDATAAREAFLAWQKALIALSPDDEADLRRERDRLQAAGTPAAEIDRAIGELRRRRLDARRQLTEFRLTLAVITAALAGRDKVIIDAADVPGKRQIFLFDPELLKPLAPRLPSDDGDRK